MRYILTPVYDTVWSEAQAGNTDTLCFNPE